MVSACASELHRAAAEGHAGAAEGVNAGAAGLGKHDGATAGIHDHAEADIVIRTCQSQRASAGLSQEGVINLIHFTVEAEVGSTVINLDHAAVCGSIPTCADGKMLVSRWRRIRARISQGSHRAGSAQYNIVPALAQWTGDVIVVNRGDAQRTGLDGQHAAEGVIAGERQCAGASLGQAVPSADHAAHAEGVTVDRDSGTGTQGHRPAAEVQAAGAPGIDKIAVPNLRAAGGQRDVARAGVVKRAAVDCEACAIQGSCAIKIEQATRIERYPASERIRATHRQRSANCGGASCWLP